MKVKTVLYLIHRWLGICICLPVAMWFATGMVMMYVGFPELSERERYAGLPALDPETILHGPAKLVTTVPDSAPIEHLMLTSSGPRPLYLLKIKGSSWRGQYADTGELVKNFPAENAAAIAGHFYQGTHPHQTKTGVHLKTLEMDQWTVSSGLADYRPLHLVSMGDKSATQLYVSSRTGQVVRDTTRKERLWNWLGANLHWIYPLQLRRHVSLWADVVVALSVTGLITIVTGAIIGFMQLRIRQRRARESFSPYRGIARYHHLLGLLALVFITTFMFSGLMSMGPWGVFDSHSSFAEQLERYQLNENGSRSALAYAQARDIQDLLKQKENPGTRQINWHWIGGQSHVTLHRSPNQLNNQPAVGDTETLDRKIQQHITRLIPDADILSQKYLEDYDTYYYSHHGRVRPLPVLRIEHSDAESTWFHIDLSSGRILERLSHKNRVERWLFNGLHSFDFPFLLDNRPAWDILLLTLCGIGLLFSVTSLILGWRSLGKWIKTLHG